MLIYTEYVHTMNCQPWSLENDYLNRKTAMAGTTNKINDLGTAQICGNSYLICE